MRGAPWKYFRFEDKEIFIDVDGHIDFEDKISTPFPSPITHATLCNNGLVATWVDHELRLARMALLPLDGELSNGISKSELRLSEKLIDVAGSSWSHALDAEPIALASNGEKIVFALYTRGVYCIDCDANELWRIPLISGEELAPGSHQVAAIVVSENTATVWTRGGKFREVSIESGEIISENQLDIECDIDGVYSSGERILISSNDGWLWEFVNGEMTVARKLRGTVQDAVYFQDEWRIISWREDIILSSIETYSRNELGVQIVIEDDKCLVLDNQGNKTLHMGE